MYFYQNLLFRNVANLFNLKIFLLYDLTDCLFGSHLDSIVFVFGKDFFFLFQRENLKKKNKINYLNRWRLSSPGGSRFLFSNLFFFQNEIVCFVYDLLKKETKLK